MYVCVNILRRLDEIDALCVCVCVCVCVCAFACVRVYGVCARVCMVCAWRERSVISRVTHVFAAIFFFSHDLSPC